MSILASKLPCSSPVLPRRPLQLNRPPSFVWRQIITLRHLQNRRQSYYVGRSWQSMPCFIRRQWHPSGAASTSIEGRFSTRGDLCRKQADRINEKLQQRWNLFRVSGQLGWFKERRNQRWKSRQSSTCELPSPNQVFDPHSVKPTCVTPLNGTVYLLMVAWLVRTSFVGHFLMVSAHVGGLVRPPTNTLLLPSSNGRDLHSSIVFRLSSTHPTKSTCGRECVCCQQFSLLTLANIIELTDAKVELI